MAGIRSVRKYMRQDVTIAARTGQDVNSMPTYETPAIAYKARLVGKRRRVWDANGNEVISSQTVYLNSGVNILPDAQVTLSTGDVGSTESHLLTPPIVATGRYPGKRGRYVYTALFLRSLLPATLLFTAEFLSRHIELIKEAM